MKSERAESILPVPDVLYLCLVFFFEHADVKCANRPRAGVLGQKEDMRARNEEDGVVFPAQG